MLPDSTLRETLQRFEGHSGERLPVVDVDRVLVGSISKSDLLITLAGSFFVVQGFVVLIEARMRPQTWPPPLARLWTFLVLVLPSPLFLCPISRLIGW